MTANLSPRMRLPLLAMGFVALVLGVGAGLARLGWAMPATAVDLAAWHGPLLLCGFFGTVIALERAVAIGRLWSYAAPSIAGIGTFAILTHALVFAIACMIVAGAVLLVATIDIQRRQPALFTTVLVAAAACWLIGSLFWAFGAAVYGVAAWWLLFLILTIAAERLELSRFLPPSRSATRAFIAIVNVMIASLIFVEHPIGRIAFGVSLVALAMWLIKQDIARRTVRARGLTRYIAVCLLAGYAWLAVGGLLIAVFDALYPSLARDAALHAIGLGFVFSMVFGHAPIIVPAVLRVSLPYRPLFYLPLVLLHASLLVRVLAPVAGFAFAQTGAMGNAIALAAFIVTMVTAAVASQRNPTAPATGAPAA